MGNASRLTSREPRKASATVKQLEKVLAISAMYGEN
jgi:hypothetical protein